MIESKQAQTDALNMMGPRSQIITELQGIISDGKTTTADKLKAIAMKIEVLGLKPSPSSSPPGDLVGYDTSLDEAMEDPALRKRAAKLEEDTQKAIDKRT